MATDSEKFRVTLLRRKAELEASALVAADDRKPVELDQQSIGRLSRIDAIAQQQMALASQRQREEELQRIEFALARLGSGEYGVCPRCGEEIAIKRLEANPAAVFCLECA